MDDAYRDGYQYMLFSTSNYVNSVLVPYDSLHSLFSRDDFLLKY